MAVHPLAGRPVPPELLIEISQIEREYYQRRFEADDPLQLVSFGTSGHRGSPLSGTFNEFHLLAITQAICDYRRGAGIEGPLFMGKDTHAISSPAQRTALEILAANQIETVIQRHDGVTPTPVISHAILAYNRKCHRGQADGIIITPSHNPPADGGIKYNPPNGGPADTDVTAWIQDRANTILRAGNKDIRRVPFPIAIKARTTHQDDFSLAYVRDLSRAIDMECISAAGITIGADPLGGSAVHYWAPIADLYSFEITVVNPHVDPTFRFMTLDHDGQIRMDCSSPYAMAGLVHLKDRFRVAFGNDPDADRHGIVAPAAGLMNPNDYLAVAVNYLLTHRPEWPADAVVGKTLVSSGIIDRIVRSLGRRLAEVPVGFKWFAPGLYDGSYCFGGEESGGASFLARDGTVWTTDKDGLLLALLAAEITARSGKDPAQHYQELAASFGMSYYKRIDAPLRPEQKSAFKELTPGSIRTNELAGEPIIACLTRAPGNNAPIGGLKVATENGWFAARASGTEDVYKLYAESFKSQEHLEAIIEQSQELLTRLLGA